MHENTKKAIYVQLDDCHFQFLSPGSCSTHRTAGHDASCAHCLRAVQPGLFAVKPILRSWRFLRRLRQVRDCEPQTVSVAAAGERQSLLDARHNGRPRLVCILDVSEDVFGDGEMVDRLCDAVETEIISPGEIHQSQQEDPGNH